MCHEVKCSDAMAYTLLTVAKVATHSPVATHLRSLGIPTARVTVLARARAKSGLELAGPVHLVRMKITHRRVGVSSALL